MKKTKKISIKLKVAFWFALLMLGLSALVVVFLLAVGERVVMNATQNELMMTVENSRGDVEYEYGVLDFDDDLKYFDNGVSLSVYNDKQQLLYGRSPAGFPTDLAFSHGTLRTIDDAWYVYDMRYQQEGYGEIWMRGVLAADGSESAFAALTRLAFFLLPILAVLAAAGAYWLTHKAFQPVREITQTAQEISRDGNLERRIGLGGGNDEIYTLAAAFDHMFASLQAAFEKERQFTSDASHELRTPVSVMLSECEYALENQPLHAETQETLESLQAQAKRMAALIAQLLAFARADQGKAQVPKERVHFSQLAGTVVEQIAETASEKNITVESEIQPEISLDGNESLLVQLLWNLLENGVRYGNPGGRLRFSLRCEGDTIIGITEDDGIGIAPEHIEKIWERFYRADASRSSQGFGLGLPMCRHIVQLHGGTIRVESVPGQGSKFIFELPKIT
jgi:signal transduction histidine kinase